MFINAFYAIKYLVDVNVEEVIGTCGFGTRYIVYKKKNVVERQFTNLDDLATLCDEWCATNGVDLLYDYGLSNYVLTVVWEPEPDNPEKWYHGLTKHDDKTIVKIEGTSFAIEALANYIPIVEETVVDDTYTDS